ncbi:DUF6427 family protein [Polaribacter sp. KT 15]|uniref:DUF6427 family protein n=1 Tax=Polaribacter sp. KT 15 TaxID=1896175 RepID=UPI00090BF6C1|nr:DUF6427 family protein [Polaribacter sp. KT 15]SHM88325.1 hypothetical protein SAMN05720268_1170 [Polaribacter sp. KT 15]
MLANFLGKSKPINFIILLSVFICLFLFTTLPIYLGQDFQFKLVFEVAGLIALFLFLFFFYNFVVTKNNLTFDNSYAFFVFTVLLAFFLPLINNYKTLTIILLYILFLRKIYSLKSPKKILQKLFDSGFWLSILFILEPFTAMFTILIYAGIFVHQKPVINRLIAPLIGFACPLIIYFTYCFWQDQLYVFTNLFYFNSFKSLLLYSKNNFNWIIILIIILSVVSIIMKSPKTLSVNNSFKKSWLLLLLNFTISLFFALLIPNKNGSEMLFLLFPASVICANGIELIKNNIIKNVVLSVLILSLVVFLFLL